jgi:hypothetical protein
MLQQDFCEKSRCMYELVLHAIDWLNLDELMKKIKYKRYKNIKMLRHYKYV